MPSDPPAQTLPAARSFLYPAFIIAGTAISPTTISTAPTMPELAAKIAQSTIVVSASPPRTPPSQTRTATNRRSAIPDRSSIAPMKMNSGIAARMKLDEVSRRLP